MSPVGSAGKNRTSIRSIISPRRWKRPGVRAPACCCGLRLCGKWLATTKHCSCTAKMSICRIACGSVAIDCSTRPGPCAGTMVTRRANLAQPSSSVSRWRISCCDCALAACAAPEHSACLSVALVDRPVPSSLRLGFAQTRAEIPAAGSCFPAHWATVGRGVSVSWRGL